MFDTELFKSDIFPYFTYIDIYHIKLVSKYFYNLIKSIETATNMGYLYNPEVVAQNQQWFGDAIIGRIINTCYYCGASFRSERKLNRHIKQLKHTLSIKVPQSGLKVRIYFWADEIYLNSKGPHRTEYLTFLMNQNHPIQIETRVGSMIIRNIQYWSLGMCLLNNALRTYLQYVGHNSFIRIILINGNLWLSLKQIDSDQLIYIHILQIKKYI